ARQRIRHLHIRIEHRRNPRLAREPKANKHAADRADDEGVDRLLQRHPQVPPDGAFDEPFDDLRGDVFRLGEEKRWQPYPPEELIGREYVPQRNRGHRDQHLTQEEFGTGHWLGAPPRLSAVMPRESGASSTYRTGSDYWIARFRGR